MDLTVDQAIQLALTNNPAYQVSQQEVRQYRYRLMQNFGFLPEATLSGSKILDEKLMTIEIPSFVPGGEPTKASLRFQLDYCFHFPGRAARVHRRQNLLQLQERRAGPEAGQGKGEEFPGRHHPERAQDVLQHPDPAGTAQSPPGSIFPGREQLQQRQEQL